MAALDDPRRTMRWLLVAWAVVALGMLLLDWAKLVGLDNDPAHVWAGRRVWVYLAGAVFGGLWVLLVWWWAGGVARRWRPTALVPFAPTALLWAWSFVNLLIWRGYYSDIEREVTATTRREARDYELAIVSFNFTATYALLALGYAAYFALDGLWAAVDAGPRALAPPDALLTPAQQRLGRRAAV